MAFRRLGVVVSKARPKSYYERWITAIEQLLVEKGVITRAEIDRKTQELEEARAW